MGGGPGELNIDGLGKAYVIDRCVEVARRFAPAGLLNIGGDIRAWGAVDWTIAVADPRRPEDNAAPLTMFRLRDAAVATSGGYARGAHILDARTRRPVDYRAAATAIAGDCVSANALSTALCILDPRQGDALAARFGRGHVIAHADVMQLPGAEAPRPGQLAVATAWPKDFAVSVNVALAPPQGRKPKRPYVAVWVEDATGKPVRTITLWGDKPKWVREMTYWWKATGGNQKIINSVTRATRGPGQYTVVWDGLDDAGKPVQQGEYKIVVEVNREHGRHVKEAVSLKCGGDKASAELKATPESSASKVEYGPRGK
jgi:hypothetical protein